MIVECCDCGKEYPLEGNLYETSPVRQEPLLVCPHCRFQHVLSFLPVPAQHDRPTAHLPSRPHVDKIKLGGGPYYWVLEKCRYATAARVGQGSSGGEAVTGWDPADDFILGIQLSTTKGPLAKAHKLRWRNTDGGSFADVASTGEIDFTATTDLTDDGTFTASGGYRLMDVIPGYSPNVNFGMESEGDNILPDTGTFQLDDDRYCELHWALNPSSAGYLDEFEFELWDVTEGASVGTCPHTITMMADPAGGCPVQMMHYARQRRS